MKKRKVTKLIDEIKDSSTEEKIEMLEILNKMKNVQSKYEKKEMLRNAMSEDPENYFITVTIKPAIDPICRYEIFADPLEDLLMKERI